MSKPIVIKSFLFIAAIVSLLTFWVELINSWKSNIQTAGVGILPVTYEYDTIHQGDAAGFAMDIQLSNFDVEKSEVGMLISVNYDRSLDQDGQFPRLGSVVLNLYQPTSDSWLKTDVSIPIDNTQDLMNSRARTITILSNYAVKIPISPLGWYPYEVYNTEIEPELVLSYSGGSRGRASIRKNINIPSTLQYHIPQYKVSICNSNNSDPIFSDCEKLPTDIHKIVIQQHSDRKVLFDIIVVLFMIFTLLTFWINELSNLLEVTIGLLLGIWGLRAVILPDKIPYDVTWGGERLIMNFYISLGTMIFFWIIASAFTSLLIGLEHMPNQVFEFLVVRFPSLMNSLFDINEYWDTNTVAEYLGIHPNTVRELARNNNLRGDKVHNKWRFAVQEVIRARNRGL